jgi:predicted ATPase/DNA-binding SARP family transcriptional activator
VVIDISLAGDVSVGCRSERRRLPGSQQALAFAVLTLERRHGVTRDALAEVLWPDDRPTSWPTALRNVVSRVRAFVVALDLDLDAEGPLTVRDGRYRLHLPRDVRVDVEEAERRLAAAQAALRDGDAEGALPLADAAVACLDQPFFPDRRGVWVVARRARMAEGVIAGLELTSRAAADAGDHGTAVCIAAGAVGRAPLRESAHRALMAAHAAAGNRAEALRAYQRLRHALADELGIDPAPATEAAYLDLLGSRPEVPVEPVEPVTGTGPVPGTGSVAAPVTGAADVLDAAWAAASGGQRRLAVVTGGTGAGRSRLVVDAARRASASGGLVLFGGCDRPGRSQPPPPSASPYEPFVEALDGYLRARGHEVPASAAALCRAVATTVVAATRDRPVLVVLDDVQRAAPPFFPLLRHVVEHADGVRLLVVVAADDETSPGRTVRELGVLAGAPWVDHVHLPPHVDVAADRARPLTVLLATGPTDHLAALRAVVEAHHGHPAADREGELCALFDRAGDAITAALATGRTPPGRDLVPVRVVVHTGEAGPAGELVDRARRLADTGHAGQVLVSAATAELAGDTLPDDVALVETGTWALPGGRHQRLYQLRHRDLAAVHPPPPPPPPPAQPYPAPGRLPRHPTSLVGRDGKCGEILGLLRSRPLVTLTGEGGIGKSRLAVEAAGRARLGDHPDGVRFCDATTAADAEGLAERLAAAVGAPTGPGDGARRLTGALRDAELLLVVDNCERLRGPVAALVARVLDASPGSRVLATSRVPLRARGEHVLQVPPLGWPWPARGAGAEPGTDPGAGPGVDADGGRAAVRLLVDRARAAGAPVADDDPALADIARRLDGIPLAIELVAPRLATLPAEVLAGRLDRVLDAVDDHPGAGAGGQPTLRATIEWSFDRLHPEARRLLGGLSVFRGGWTLDSAAAVADALALGADALPELTAELVEQSLIRLAPGGSGAPGTVRYGMLVTIRDRAADDLAATGRAAAVAERHAAHFADLAERALPRRPGPLAPEWVGRLAVELDNLRAAHRWSVDAGRPADGVPLVAALVDDALGREGSEVGRGADEPAPRPDVGPARPRRGGGQVGSHHLAVGSRS